MVCTMSAVCGVHSDVSEALYSKCIWYMKEMTVHTKTSVNSLSSIYSVSPVLRTIYLVRVFSRPT